MNGKHSVISLIGRPNVGKSSIFNKLMGRAGHSITYNEPGVTRDRHYGIAKTAGREETMDFILVDTGGFYPHETGGEPHKFFPIMKEHAETAINESDLILFVVDVREGLMPFDRVIVDYIRTQRKPFLVLANKFDSEDQNGHEGEFYELGISEDQLFPVSASHGYGCTTLENRISKEVHLFEKNQRDTALEKGITPREEVVSRIALIGAPNAGKSTLLNRLMGAERALVSPIPGTTVDPIQGFFDLYFGTEAATLDAYKAKKEGSKHLITEYDDFRQSNPDLYEVMEATFLEEDRFLSSTKSDPTDLETFFSDDEEGDEKDDNHWKTLHIVDTAGIRRRSTIKEFVEQQSVYRSLRCISEAEIVIIVVDSTKGLGHQDLRLIDIAVEKGKSVIVALNKVDLMNSQYKNEKERLEWVEDLRAKNSWLSFVDIIPISAKKGDSVNKLKRSIKKTVLVRHRGLPTSALNRCLFSLVERNPVTVKNARGARLKIKYCSMMKSTPPTIILFTNKSKGIPEHYKRYLKNGLRQNFKLDNTPVHLIFRTGADLVQRMKLTNDEKAVLRK